MTKNRDFLYQAVDIFYQIQSLNQKNKEVSLLCNTFKGLQLYEGIEKLAHVAGKEIKSNSSGDETFPIESYFEFCGVRFFQLKSVED